MLKKPQITLAQPSRNQTAETGGDDNKVGKKGRTDGQDFLLYPEGILEKELSRTITHEARTQNLPA